MHEVGHLVAQGFAEAQARDVQVSPAEEQLELAIGLGAFARVHRGVASGRARGAFWDGHAVDTLVVDLDDAVGIDVVVDDHLARSDDDDFADLVWIKP